MAITFICKCGKALKVGDEYAGQEGACPSCGEAIRIPSVEQMGGQFTKEAPAPRKPTANEAWAQPVSVAKRPPEEDDGDYVLTTHAGTVLGEDDDLFVPAPKEIGRVYSAFTSLQKHVEPMSLPVRVAVAIMLFGFCLFVGVVLLLLAAGLPRARLEEICMVPLLPGLVGVVVVGIFVWWTRFKHTCSYVGSKGTALFECSGSRENVRRSDIFLYRDAAELRTTQTRSYYNGVYTGTSYGYTWSDDKGRTVYHFAGSYSSEAGTPKLTDAYYFALMAETAWTFYLARDLDRMLEDDEPLFFGLTGGDYIEISPDRLILVQGGQSAEFRARDIDKVVVDQGMVAIWEPGAKAGWFVNTGIHQFPYANLGNARFFFLAAEKLLGIRF